ncbi:MAG: DUF362 domain-containing protein [Coriobacteriia bacterium]|nr:DUF362 domain-containing protein [Coriobacteriia bacterium]
MERREFCRYLGVCTVAACTGGLAGCARLIDWSSGSRDTASRSMSGTETTSVQPTGTSVPTATPEAPAPPPDLAVWTGDDPESNVRAAIAALGGMERFVKRGAKVVVKPNVLTGRAPKYATTTNPQVLAGVVKMCLEAGAASVVVLDRPTSSARQAFDVSGLTAATQSAGGTLKILSDRNFERVEIPGGRSLTSWPLVADVFDADVFINVPIAKTHGMAGLTLSMKNLMGIMGGERGTIHQDFAQKIVDVNTLVKPHLVVLDAYRMLIRNGPTGGDLRDVRLAKTVVAGTSQVAVDAFGTTLFEMKPTDLDYLVRAAEQGLGIIDLALLSVARGQA